MLRLETTPTGPHNVLEFGTVKTEGGFKALYAMSPYARSSSTLWRDRSAAGTLRCGGGRNHDHYPGQSLISGEGIRSRAFPFNSAS